MAQVWFIRLSTQFELRVILQVGFAMARVILSFPQQKGQFLMVLIVLTQHLVLKPLSFQPPIVVFSLSTLLLFLILFLMLFLTVFLIFFLIPFLLPFLLLFLTI